MMDFFYEDDHRPTSPIHPIEAVKKLLVKTGDLGGGLRDRNFGIPFGSTF